MYHTSKNIKNSKIFLGFFSKNNGFSKNNYTSLNCSYSSGDKVDYVTKNIDIAKKAINLEDKSLKIINQIHSRNVFLIKQNDLNNKFQGDGLITQDKKISLAILTADCCPIFLFDNNATFIACLHVGWKGCYLNIIENALIKIKKIQPKVESISAIIGPHLGKNNFEVEEEFKKKFIQKSNKYNKFFNNSKKQNKYLFDMGGLISFQLIDSQIKNIENIGLDTYDNKDLFFSHRRSTHLNQLPTGRMINIIGFSK